MKKNYSGYHKPKSKAYLKNRNKAKPISIDEMSERWVKKNIQQIKQIQFVINKSISDSVWGMDVISPQIAAKP